MPHCSPSRCSAWARSDSRPPSGQQQERFGAVGLVELLAGQERAVQTTGPGGAEQRGHHRRQRPVPPRRDRDRAVRVRLGGPEPFRTRSSSLPAAWPTRSRKWWPRSATPTAHDRRRRPRRAEIHAWQEVTRADRNARDASQLEESWVSSKQRQRSRGRTCGAPSSCGAFPSCSSSCWSSPTQRLGGSRSSPSCGCLSYGA